MQNDFLHFFKGHLDQLKTELAAYPKQSDIWLAPDGISNSAGTLTCHLLGNLNHFIGHGLGNTGYVRDRPLEFSARDVPRKELIMLIDKTSDMLAEVMPGVDVSAPFPPELFSTECTVHQALLRLLGHFNYHLGQINYHRRLTVGSRQ